MPLFEQYDCIVGSRTVRRPEQADAAVLMLDAGGRRRPAIAVSIDGNGRRVAADPYRGTVEAVLECAANLACVGAEPLGLTNCLNFGNPEKPHIAWQLTRAVARPRRRLPRARRARSSAATSRSTTRAATGPIYPTPVVGMVGELPDAARAGRLGFAAEGDAIALVAARAGRPSLAGSELAKLRGEPPEGELPAADLGELRARARRDPRGRPRRRAALARTTSPRAASPSRWPSAASPAGIGATVDARRRGEDDAVRRGPGRVRRLRPARRAFAAFGAAARVIGTVGGDALAIAGGAVVPSTSSPACTPDGLAALLR